MATNNLRAAFDKSGNVLTITIDVSKRYGPSKSGLSDIVGSTDGFVALASPSQGEIRVNLSVVQRKARAESKQGRATLKAS